MAQRVYGLRHRWLRGNKEEGKNEGGRNVTITKLRVLFPSIERALHSFSFLVIAGDFFQKSSLKAWVRLDLHVPTCSVTYLMNGNGSPSNLICLSTCIKKLMEYQCECFTTSPAFKSIRISLLSGSTRLNNLSSRKISFVSMVMLNAII